MEVSFPYRNIVMGEMDVVQGNQVLIWMVFLQQACALTFLSSCAFLVFHT